MLCSCCCMYSVHLLFSFVVCAFLSIRALCGVDNFSLPVRSLCARTHLSGVLSAAKSHHTRTRNKELNYCPLQSMQVRDLSVQRSSVVRWWARQRPGRSVESVLRVLAVFLREFRCSIFKSRCLLQFDDHLLLRSFPSLLHFTEKQITRGKRREFYQLQPIKRGLSTLPQQQKQRESKTST